MEQIRVELGPRAYPIALSSSAGTGFPAFLTQCVPLSRRALVVSDTHTSTLADSLYRAVAEAGLACARATIPAGEASKSLPELSRLYDALASIPADRQTVVIAVGGGVVGDLSGFAAATYNRGLPLIMIPTTLLAMVDSSVGGKTGINHPGGKNLIGAFHQPRGVWIDTAFLDSLPAREFRSGLAEVVKYGVILDAEFFSRLEAMAAALLAREPASLRAIIRRSCELKALVVEQDEREETGLRAVLNYGHTFAHAFEAVSGYGHWLHGEAVAAGMVCASRLAERLGRIPAEMTTRQIALLKALQLPVAPDPEWDADAMIAIMQRDKKATAQGLRFVLPTRMGHVELVENVPEQMVREVLRP